MGITSVEYQVDERLSYINNDLDLKDRDKNYSEKIFNFKLIFIVSHLFDESFEKKFLETMQSSKQQYCKLEMWINLPYEMII